MVLIQDLHQVKISEEDLQQPGLHDKVTASVVQLLSVSPKEGQLGPREISLGVNFECDLVRDMSGWSDSSVGIITCRK